jgi:hypothetical protein
MASELGGQQQAYPRLAMTKAHVLAKSLYNACLVQNGCGSKQGAFLK